MFTGIIEEIGSIRRIIPIRNGKKIFVNAQKVLSDLKVGDSMAVSGTCLTVAGLSKDSFMAEVVGETLLKTTIKRWTPRKKVNLERALQAADRFSGHLVQGHVNGIGRIVRMIHRGENWNLLLQIPQELTPYTIPEGSIAVDGVSLTIAEITGRIISISIIPHTFKNTIISTYKAGHLVNIEIDFLARYIEKLLLTKKGNTSTETFSSEWFKSLGYQ